MEKSVEQYQAWGGGLTLPIWTDRELGLDMSIRPPTSSGDAK